MLSLMQSLLLLLLLQLLQLLLTAIFTADTLLLLPATSAASAAPLLPLFLCCYLRCDDYCSQCELLSHVTITTTTTTPAAEAVAAWSLPLAVCQLSPVDFQEIFASPIPMEAAARLLLQFDSAESQAENWFTNYNNSAAQRAHTRTHIYTNARIPYFVSKADIARAERGQDMSKSLFKSGWPGNSRALFVHDRRSLPLAPWRRQLLSRLFAKVPASPTELMVCTFHLRGVRHAPRKSFSFLKLRLVPVRIVNQSNTKHFRHESRTQSSSEAQSLRMPLEIQRQS